MQARSGTSLATRTSTKGARGPKSTRRRPKRPPRGPRSSRRPEGCGATAATTSASRRTARPATRYIWATAAMSGVLRRSFLMKMGSDRALARLQGWAEGLPCLIFISSSRFEADFALSRTKRSFGYCSLIFCDRARVYGEQWPCESLECTEHNLQICQNACTRVVRRQGHGS